MILKPKGFADYFPTPAHNQSMNKVQRTGTFYSLFPGPFFGSYSPFLLPKIRVPHPPTLWRPLFDPHFAGN